jgi:hypothetical protein
MLMLLTKRTWSVGGRDNTGKEGIPEKRNSLLVKTFF